MLEIVIHNAKQHEQKWLRQGKLRLAQSAGDLPTMVVHDPSGRPLCIDIEYGTTRDAQLIQLTNHGQTIVLPGGKRIAAGMTKALTLPTQLCVGSTNIFLQAEITARPHDTAITHFPSLRSNPQEYAALMKQLGSAPAAQTLANWFEALSRLQQIVAGSEDFFTEAAFALFDPGGLDVGMILLHDNGAWRIAASHVTQADPRMTVRRALLEQVLEHRCTLFHDAKAIAEGQFADCQEFVVVSPFFNALGEIAGVAYGVRFDHENNHRHGIRPLEAQFVQAVADTVSAALTRIQKETEAATMRARIEQIFSPKVAKELERNPQLLNGDQREVTVLFCDLRGCTSLCESLSPRETYSFMGDVMDRFTHCVTRYEGVILDYFGDGLAAFWNAPLSQPEHAWLACQTAFAMQKELPDINADWLGLIGRNLRMGIGIHTGIALVGNAGSATRLKYGPRGSMVNAACRIEQATKTFGVPLLLSATTWAQLQGKVHGRRVANQKLDGLETPIELYQAWPSNAVEQLAIAKPMEQAIELFEKQEFAESQSIFLQLKQEGADDPICDYYIRKVREQLQLTK
jgi:adenylate cyclase